MTLWYRVRIYRNLSYGYTEVPSLPFFLKTYAIILKKKAVKIFLEDQILPLTLRNQMSYPTPSWSQPHAERRSVYHLQAVGLEGHFQSIDLHSSQEHIPVFSYPCASSLTQQFIESMLIR